MKKGFFVGLLIAGGVVFSGCSTAAMSSAPNMQPQRAYNSGCCDYGCGSACHQRVYVRTAPIVVYDTYNWDRRYTIQSPCYGYSCRTVNYCNDCY